MGNKSIIHRSHNVYVLGAGFSFPAGLPVITNFLDVMRESVGWLASEGRNHELMAVEEVFKLRLRAAGAAYRMQINPENIEELFSLASALKNRSTQSDLPEESDYVSLAIAATLDYAKSKRQTPTCRMLIRNKNDFMRAINSPGPEWRFDAECADRSSPGDYFSVPIYDAYAGILSGNWCSQADEARNTIITFNYDTLFEDSLKRLGIPFTYGFPNENQPSQSLTPLPVLKLHGSVNWSTVERPPLTEDDMSFLDLPSDESFYVTHYDSYGDLIEKLRTPLLLPPT